MGRSSHFWAEIVGGTVSPPPLVRKAVASGGDWDRWLGCHAPDVRH